MAWMKSHEDHLYCIYTDSDVPVDKGNFDHVIPLSLGGCNQFTVWSDLHYNSKVGSEVDGALNKDFFIAPHLMHAGVSGHSGRPATPRVKKATVNGRPAQVTLTPNGFEAWDARERRTLDDDELVGSAIELKISIGAFTPLRFLAKVALGGGHFVYGDAFRTAINCDALRKIVKLDIEAAKTDRALLDAGILISDRFHEDSKVGGPGYLYRVACETIKRSVFIVRPYLNGLEFHVGITGSFVGTIFCPGNTDGLPFDGDHDLGHAILLAPGDMERISFRKAMHDLQRMLDKMAPTTDEGGGVNGQAE